MVQFFIESESTDLLREDYLDEVVGGRVQVCASTGQAIALGGDCEIIFIHPQTGEWLPFGAVMISMQRRAQATQVEIRLASTGPKRRAVLEAFLNEEGPNSAELPKALIQEEPPASDASLVLDLIHSPESSDESMLRPSARPEDEISKESFSARLPELDLEPSQPGDAKASDAVDADLTPPKERQTSGTQGGGFIKNVHQRVRNLSAPERERLARSGGQAERIALERAYGATLWEALLSNPQITGPEVAKIAKNRTASAPILQIIIGNRNWLTRPEVKRGLLSNTRLQSGQIERVLSAFNRSELKLAQKQSAYPHRVRQLVSKALGELS